MYSNNNSSCEINIINMYKKKYILEIALNILTPKEFQVLDRIYNLSQDWETNKTENIAKELFMTRTRVLQIEKKALNKLYKYMQNISLEIDDF